MIYVIARIEVQPGTRDAFLDEFHRIVPIVQKEHGCIEYGPAVDAETDIERQETNPNLVTIIEKWESLECLKDHLAAPHMQDYRQRVANYVAGSRLNILRPA